jgi:hypothetical protein
MIMREALRFHEFRDASITSETTDDALIETPVSRMDGKVGNRRNKSTRGSRPPQ